MKPPSHVNNPCLLLFRALYGHKQSAMIRLQASLPGVQLGGMPLSITVWEDKTSQSPRFSSRLGIDPTLDDDSMASLLLTTHQHHNYPIVDGQAYPLSMFNRLALGWPLTLESIPSQAPPSRDYQRREINGKACELDQQVKTRSLELVGPLASEIKRRRSEPS